MKIGPLEFKNGGIEWVRWPYYFYPFNWLPVENRYWGREWFYYDGPHDSFGFWFFNVSWRMPWTPWTVEAPWEKQ